MILCFREHKCISKGQAHPNDLLMFCKGRATVQNIRQSWKVSREPSGPELGGSGNQGSCAFQQSLAQQPWYLMMSEPLRGPWPPWGCLYQTEMWWKPWKEAPSLSFRYMSSFSLKGIFCDYLLCQLESPSLEFTNEAPSSMEWDPGPLDAEKNVRVIAEGQTVSIWS